MKKILTLIMAISSLFFVCGCNEKSDLKQEEDAFQLANLTQICSHWAGHNLSSLNNIYFFKDEDTQAIYMYVSGGSYGRGITPYYNKNGEIMLYPEFEKIHIIKYHSGD